MSAVFVDPAFSALLSTGLKATALVAAAALLHLVWRRRASAATRHLLWTVVAAGLLTLPLASRLAPQWPITIRTATPTTPVTSMAGATPTPGPESHEVAAPTALPIPAAASVPAPAPASAPTTMSWPLVASSVYGIGVIAIAMFFALHHWRLNRLARRSVVVDDGEWLRLLDECRDEMRLQRPVRLLRGCESTVPMTFGTRRPTILMPAIADTWTEDRRRAVLRHELAHVARYDCLTQTIALVACAMYWPHPGVWRLARQLRIERELACDDRVLTAGTEARDYAGHLLDIAYSLGGRRAPALAVTMARPSQVEGRLLAALDAARNRRAPGRRTRLTLAVVAAIMIVGLAGATPTMVSTVNQGQALDAATIDTAAIDAASPDPARSAAPGVSAAASHDSQPRETVHELKKMDWAPMVAARRLVAAVTGMVTEIAQDNLPGTWEIRPTTTAGVVHLRLMEGNNSSGRNIPISSLEGLTEAQLAAAAGPVTFRITRDAGTLRFEGVGRSGVAAGTFTFTPNAAFPAELVKRGFTQPTAREQYQMARHDIGYAFLDELTRLGYAKPDTALLVTAGQHGVDVVYLREMAALGYALGSLPPLITLRDHGVTPDYVRGMATAGYKGLSADMIRKARDHGVNPEYAQGMRDAGYPAIPLEALIETRDHGVTPEYVRVLADGGYRGLPLEEVVRVRDHGVSEDYIKGMRDLGYSLPIAELVRARDHGVDVNYVREMAALGFARTPMDRLIKVRDHGVTPQYAKEMKGLGYEGLGLDDLVSLRDHGVTPDRVRSANARAGTKLPIDLLRSLAAGGGLR
jgi:beta-lactamase regulating signal transducer with metallopeptidase domain